MTVSSPSSVQSSATFDRLVLFDGKCAVCDATVQWVLDHDPDGRFHFAPLQGETAQAVLARHPEVPRDLDSLIFVRRLPDGSEKLMWYSTGILAIAGGLDAPWSALSAFRLFPRFVRDPLYRAFAAVRYRVFGRLESCRMPEPEWEARFLP